ncbi:hypothetical protein D1871_21245 [Nakamurella silvestris]|nr:hypothetical protein D1871_21245 [Nakamurella silvestris]
MTVEPGIDSWIERPARRYAGLQVTGWGAQILALVAAITGAVVGARSPVNREFADPCGTALSPRIDPFDLSTSCPPELFGAARELAFAAFWIAAGLLAVGVVLLGMHALRTPPSGRGAAVDGWGNGLLSAGMLVLVAGLATGLTPVITMDSIHVGDCGPALFHFLIEPPTELCAPEYYHPQDTVALVLMVIGAAVLVLGAFTKRASLRYRTPSLRGESTSTR